MMRSVGPPIGNPSGTERVAPESGPIDRETFECLCALQNPGRPSVLSKVLRIYLSDAANLMDTLRVSVAGGDSSRARSAAHSLTSSSSVVGALGLARLCEALEAVCSEEDTVVLMAEIEREHDRVQAVLKEEMERRRL